ncbi:ABC transporter permease [Streptomyces sp. RS2]|uniref:ABC transporter permease n=1 Tax=Streptomyces sp. RS2 TaxID=1451205 RepID=UPI0021F82AFB|nr:ABC transporter permease [Streptomyces sp. RS2]MCW1100185.1 ABC transporter permease [Streptomyces sp. RS2]
MRETASQGLLPVNATLAGALLILLFIAATVAAVLRLSLDGSYRRAREIVAAGARATAQLALVSLILGWVLHHGWVLFAFLFLMFAVATRTAGRRITSNATWWWAALPIATPVVPVVAGLTLSGLLPVRGIAMIPVTGILIGGALTATVTAGRHALDELDSRHCEFEAYLALGFLPRASRIEVARPSASEALLPGLDQTRTVGLVTLPGAFVGMLLGGASPLTAGAVQLFVLVALMAVQALSVAVTVELIARSKLNRSAVKTL